MFGLLAYIFKTIISIGIGYIIGYNYHDDSRNSSFQLFTTLSSLVVTSFVGILMLLNEANLILIAIIFLAVLHYISLMHKDLELLEKYKILFAAINGLIIGLGYVFYAIIITLVFSYIANNFDIISTLLVKDKHLKKNDDKDGKNDLDLNDEEM